MVRKKILKGVWDMRNIMKFSLVLLVSWALMLGIGYAGEKEYSGFLGEYPSFEKGQEGVDLRWINKDVDFKKYDKIMMDQVVFYFTDAKGLDPNELKELSDAYHQAFIKEFGSDMFTDTPGPNVIRIRSAITDLKASHPAISGVTTVMPIGLALSFIKRGTLGGHTGVGSASMEVEFLDSASNERLAAAIDKRPGDKLEGLSKWKAAEAAFEFWAKRTKTRFDEFRGVKASQ